MKKWLMNPVLNKELKLRFRSGKSYAGLLFYLAALSVMILGIIYIEMQTGQSGYFNPQESRETFMILTVLQLGLILFITPGLTAGVVSSERERQTLNMLLTTAQSSSSIIIGKLLSSIAFLLLLIAASLPLYSIVFLFGGISPGQLLSVFGLYVLTILLFASIGVFISTIIRRTIVAMVTSYAVTLFLAGGTAFITLLLIQIYETMQSTAPNPLIYIVSIFNTPYILISMFMPELADQMAKYSGIEMQSWIGHVLVSVLLMTAATLLSIRYLRPRMKTKKTKAGETK